jgi:hypothetical protein
MANFTLRTMFAAALIATTASATAARPSPAEMPVASTKPVSSADYGDAAALAARGGAPVEVALRIVGPFEGSTQHIVQVNEGGEAPSVSRVTVVRDGLLDDSVRAERWDIRLERTPAGMWRITEVKRAWLCRRGGQRDRFAATACP